MNILIYFKGPADNRYMPMNPITGELFNRLVYAPYWPENMIPAFKEWIDSNKQSAPECKLQIRQAGTGRIIYS